MTDTITAIEGVRYDLFHEILLPYFLHTVMNPSEVTDVRYLIDRFPIRELSRLLHTAKYQRLTLDKFINTIDRKNFKSDIAC